MRPIEVRRIDQKRFNALAALSRSPAAAYITSTALTLLVIPALYGWFAREFPREGPLPSAHEGESETRRSTSSRSSSIAS